MGTRYRIQCSMLIVYTCCIHQGCSVIPGLAMDYFFYTTPQSWNEARSVCQSIGGELAKLDSPEVMDIVYQKAIEDYPGTDHLNTAYWVGLVHHSSTKRLWVGDCATLTLASVYDATYDSVQLCYKIIAVGTGQPTGCGEKNEFLCERQSPNECASYRTMYSNVGTNILTGRKTQQECEAACTDTVECLYVMYLSSTKCYLFTTGTESETTTMRYKFCATFNVNSTNPNPATDASDDPNYFCGDNASSSIVLPTMTPSSTYATASTINAVVPCSPVLFTSSPCECNVSSPPLLTTTVTSPVSCQSSSVPTPSCVFPLNTLTIALNLSRQEAVQVAEEIKKNLTIDEKTTSSYIRSLTSAQDPRTTATAMGLVGMACIATPMTLLIFLDFKRFYDDIRGITKEMPTSKKGKQ